MLTLGILLTLYGAWRLQRLIASLLYASAFAVVCAVIAALVFVVTP